MKEELLIKNVRETRTFEVEGSFKTLEDLLKQLIHSGDSISLGIDELPSGATRFMKSIDHRVKTAEAFISMSCNRENYSDIEEYIKQFLEVRNG